MKKLYKIRQLHGAPKDSETLINSYVVKINDEEVFDHIAEKLGYYQWQKEDFDYEYQTFDEMKAEVLEEKGDLESDDGWEDAHYGVTKYGWEDMGEITDEEIKVLVKLGVLEE